MRSDRPHLASIGWPGRIPSCSAGPVSSDARTLPRTTACAKLARAHKQMAPEDIAEHALALATVVESMDETIRQQNAIISSTAVSFSNAVHAFRQAQDAIRTVNTLNERRRFKDARELVTHAAGLDLVEVPLVMPPKFISAEEAWPEVFSPTPILSNGGQ